MVDRCHVLDRIVVLNTPESLAVAARQTEAVVRAAGFWTAVLLPVVYLSLLLAVPSTVVDPPVLGAVILLNVAGLVVGHDYSPGDGVEEP